MRIGIYGSSFDPITNGHLWSANTIAQREELDKVILLPSSSNRWDKNIGSGDCHRMAMLELAVAGNERFEIDDHEMKAPEGLHYTFYTMQYFREKYSGHQLFFLLGADLLAQLPNWSHAGELMEKTNFIVIERNNIPMRSVLESNPLLKKYEKHFTLVYKGIVNEISSSYIRGEFAAGRDPRYLLPETVYHYIIKNGIYRNKSGMV
jgi:nicotinate-nucleotide adenylyltransferase